MMTRQYKPSLVPVALILTLVVLLATLFTGQQVAQGMTGIWQLLTGEASPYQSIVVWQWRASRALGALIIGAGLGVSGAVFQSLVRNPLGSPDITGFNVGAFTGVLLSIAWFGNLYWMSVLGAILGGLGAATLVYLFAYREGHSGFRLIIVGIAISATLTAFNQWLSLSVSLETAMTAALWSAGSLNGMTWSKVLPAAILLILLMCIALAMNSRMKLLEMGDDTAAALGVSVNKSRLALMFVGVSLTAVATAITGPIAFISLAAPQIARRLENNASISLTASALVGAMLLLAADFLAQHAWQGITLPVGLVTISLAGLYLVYLIVREGRL
ncbi:FecCD family ABC transporter permease [Marinomonas posidonica]|uniref:ABC-type transporter, integral membrane subunit n=1 Tax=Marinomonas posidonica (strain CECT 7376 / NCIMB 14433 / IVIA-Po-181) TaxID=491952 RepID=F6CU73_MARPP|nr:iron chelate uptake ABC transporter family permease subunit [Marinomonas posidonica]AEF55192.1 ABC-type transporter, integral membrane subunit [Marinomonas posidonica IVIA-Po-181]